MKCICRIPDIKICVDNLYPHQTLYSMPKVPHGRQQHQTQISLFYDKGIHYLITNDYFCSFSTNQRLSLPTPQTQ
jgi:hypothetical protein